jgi:hypothetical protein
LVVTHQPDHVTSRLHRIAGEAAILAGWLSFRLQDRKQAAMDWALAESLATNCGDQSVRAFAHTSRSNLYSETWSGGHGGNTALAVALLDAASAASDKQTPPVLRAWLLARRAEEHAGRGDADSAWADLELAERNFSQIEGRPSGFFSAWDAAQLAGYRGNCAQLLHAKDAPDILNAALANTAPSLVSQRSAILINLGAWYVHAEQIEEACAAVAESLRIAHDAGLAMSERRAHGVRGLMESWRSASAVKELDRLLEALNEEDDGR